MKPLTYILIMFGVMVGNAQNVLNDTLYIHGEDIQKVELSNRETSQRIELKEVEFGVYVHPFTHAPKGTYTLSIFRDRKRFVSTIKDTITYNPSFRLYVEGYYVERVIGNSKIMSYNTKAEVVAFIQKDDIDFITQNGRKNSIKVYQIKNGNKELVYER